MTEALSVAWTDCIAVVVIEMFLLLFVWHRPCCFSSVLAVLVLEVWGIEMLVISAPRCLGKLFRCYFQEAQEVRECLCRRLICRLIPIVAGYFLQVFLCDLLAELCKDIGKCGFGGNRLGVKNSLSFFTEEALKKVGARLLSSVDYFMAAGDLAGGVRIHWTYLFSTSNTDCLCL